MGSGTKDAVDEVAAGISSGISDDARLTVDKGVYLATDIHLPERLPATGVPAVLLRTPYGRRGEIDRVETLSRAAREAGFALVVQDVRGRHASNGEALPFVHEVADGEVTVDWLARQPWSNGTVIPYGDSYCGYTAWAVAATDHESVGAVLARVTTTEIAREWFGRDGLTRLQLNLPWLDFAFGRNQLPKLEDWRQRPLGSLVGLLPPALRPYLTDPPEVGIWERLPDPAVLRAARAPVVHWTGWYDCFARGQIRDFLARRRAGHRDDTLVIGPTDHEFTGLSGQVAGAEHITHLTKRLRGAYDFAVGRGRTPLNSVSPVGPAAALRSGWRLHLADAGYAGAGPEGGALTEAADPLPQVFAWNDDPADPHPSLAPWPWGVLRGGLPDQGRAHVREDAATFTGAEHRGANTTLLGHLHLKLPTKTASQNVQLVATVSDVHPDGYAVPVAEGARLLPGARGWTTTEVDLGYIGHTLQPGHRLRLALSSRSHPGYAYLGENDPSAHDMAAQTGRSAYIELQDVPELSAAYRAGDPA